MKELTRSSEKTRVFKESLFENSSYKLVALFISLILWLSILGKRDFVVTKDVDIDFIPSTGYSVISQSIDKIKVKVSGAQPLLKGFKEKNQSIVLDVSDKKAGMYDVEVVLSKIEIPAGIKVLGIRPSTVRVEISETQKTK